MRDNLNEPQDIKVSVCVVTYNQEKYIAECLQSILSQETSFDYEIIVGEDCSTDQTRKIIERLYEDNPGRLLKNFHHKNVGAVANIVSTYKLAKGKYICHIDGDDYILPGKLQAQFDALEENSDCVICSHDMLVIDSEGNLLRPSFKRHTKKNNTLLDLIETLPFFAHSSKMFVRNPFVHLWDKLDPTTLDVEVHVEQAKYGNIYHIDNPLGAYRSGTGVSAQERRVNPAIERGTDRLFKKLITERQVPNDLVAKFFATSKFRYAYQSAVLGNKIDLIRQIQESLKLRLVSFEQLLFYILSKTPRLLIFLCKRRAAFRGYR